MIRGLTTAGRQAALVRSVFKDQWKRPEEFRHWQTGRLQAIVAYAYAHVPFHRRRMEAAGVAPADIRSLDDLWRLPFSDKALVRAAYPREAVAAGYGDSNSLEEHTSGSTGMIMHMRHDLRSYDYYTALTYRQYHEMGYRPWHRRAYFRWERYETPLVGERFGLLRRYFVPINADPRDQLRMLQQARPHLICAYPSSLLLMANSLSKADLATIQPQMIELNSEQAWPHDIARIEAAFGCPAFDEYSSFEVYQMAFQCRHKRYHAVGENVILEIVDEQGRPLPPGQLGEVVVTGLNNRAMPFIRYRTGDLAAWSDAACPCGRSHMVLEEIQGRKNDLVTLPSGRTVPPLLIFGNMLRQRNVLEYQFVQQRRDRFVLRVVTNEPDREALARQLVAMQQEALGDEPIRWSVEFVNRIERGATGKLRCIVITPEAAAGQFEAPVAPAVGA